MPEDIDLAITSKAYSVPDEDEHAFSGFSTTLNPFEEQLGYVPESRAFFVEHSPHNASHAFVDPQDIS